MPSPSPLQLRIALANVDQGLDLVAKLMVDRDPDTSPEHVLLRALAWCLFHEEGSSSSAYSSKHSGKRSSANRSPSTRSRSMPANGSSSSM